MRSASAGTASCRGARTARWWGVRPDPDARRGPAGRGRAGTVYHYFASKEHLYAAVMLRWFDSFQRRLVRDELPAGPTTAQGVVAPHHRRLRPQAAVPAGDVRPRGFVGSVRARTCSTSSRTVTAASTMPPWPRFSEHDAERIRMTTRSVLGNTLRAYALGWFDMSASTGGHRHGRPDLRRTTGPRRRLTRRGQVEPVAAKITHFARRGDGRTTVTFVVVTPLNVVSRSTDPSSGHVRP